MPILEATDLHADCARAGVITGGHDTDMLKRGADAFTALMNGLVDRFAQLCVRPSGARQRATLLVAAAERAEWLARAQRSTEPVTRVADQLATKPSGR